MPTPGTYMRSCLKEALRAGGVEVGGVGMSVRACVRTRACMCVRAHGGECGVREGQSVASPRQHPLPPHTHLAPKVEIPERAKDERVDGGLVVRDNDRGPAKVLAADDLDTEEEAHERLNEK